MVSKSATKASERLVLNNDNCNSIFRIPSHLVKSYGEKLPSAVTIRVDDSGKKWKVSIEKFKDHYFFTDGWKEFAEKVGPKSLHCLKFKYGKNKKKRSGDVKATSSIPDEDKDKGKNKKKRSDGVKAASSVPRKDKGDGSGDVNGTTISVPNENKDKGAGSGDVNGTKSSILNENKQECSPVETILSFSREIKYHHRYRVDFPKGFILGTGIENGRTLRIKDGEGREWPVQVKRRNSASDVISLCKGWCDFMKANKVMLGSTVSFTWLSEDMLQTQILDVGTATQPLCNY